MSSPMSISDYTYLLRYIEENNSKPKVNSKQPWIKYVDCCFDARTSHVFMVKFRPWDGEDVIFHCTNECRDLPDNLLVRCIRYLNGV